MSEVRKLICIRCPQGCELTTTLDGNSITHIEGNICRLGEEYARDEILSPKRVVTTSVKVRNGKRPLVSVWTEDAVPKELIFPLLEQLRDIEVDAPVKPGDVILENVLDSGIRIVASGWC